MRLRLPGTASDPAFGQNSGLKASPWPGRSDAVIMPLITGTGRTNRS